MQVRFQPQTGRPVPMPRTWNPGLSPSGDRYDGSPTSDEFLQQARALQHFAQLGRLDYDRQLCDPFLSDKPLVQPGEAWSGPRILKALTQYDTQNGANQNVRCAAASFLAGAIMAGPEALGRVVERLKLRGLVPEDLERLQDIQQRLSQSTATHGDLSLLQEMLFRRYASAGEAGMLAEEQSRMRRELTGQTHRSRRLEAPEKTEQRLKDLKNGQSFTLSILNEAGTGHAVQVGRDLEGRLYLYDPAPPEGQPQLIGPDEPLFDAYVNGTFRPENQNCVSDTINY